VELLEYQQKLLLLLLLNPQRINLPLRSPQQPARCKKHVERVLMIMRLINEWTLSHFKARAKNVKTMCAYLKVNAWSTSIHFLVVVWPPTSEVATGRHKLKDGRRV
jgi:hypothetical protein